MDEAELEARKTRRKRERQAAERLLDNSSLRDALTDEQGQQLLDWGLAQTKAAAARTAKLPAAEAGSTLEDHVTAVSDVMRQVNRLVELWPSAGEEEIGNNLKKLLTGLRAVRQTALTKSQSERIEALAKQGQERDAAAAFTSLMALLNESGTETAAAPAGDKPKEKPAEPKPAEPAQEEREEGLFAGLRRFVNFGDSEPPETEENNEEN